MADTLAELKTIVAAYMLRSEVSFVQDGVDLLTKAINNARIRAQRDHNFEYSRLTVKIPSVLLSTGAPLSSAIDAGGDMVVVWGGGHTSVSTEAASNTVQDNQNNLVLGQAVKFTQVSSDEPGIVPDVIYYVVYVDNDGFKLSLTPGGTPITISDSDSTNDYVQATSFPTPIKVKLIERAFLQHPTSGFLMPVGFIGRLNAVDKSRRIASSLVFTEPAPSISDMYSSLGRIMVVQQGQQISVFPNNAAYFGTQTASLDVFLDVVKWLPPLVNDDDTDFLVEFCSDYLLLRSVSELNLLLKEDERVGISEKLVQDRWLSVLMWDNSLVAGSSEDSNLE